MSPYLIITLTRLQTLNYNRNLVTPSGNPISAPWTPALPHVNPSPLVPHRLLSAYARYLRPSIRASPTTSIIRPHCCFQGSPAANFANIQVPRRAPCAHADEGRCTVVIVKESNSRILAPALVVVSFIT